VVTHIASSRLRKGGLNIKELSLGGFPISPEPFASERFNPFGQTLLLCAHQSGAKLR
jgi:hypothetical protein